VSLELLYLFWCKALSIWWDFRNSRWCCIIRWS